MADNYVLVCSSNNVPPAVVYDVVKIKGVNYTVSYITCDTSGGVPVWVNIKQTAVLELPPADIAELGEFFSYFFGMVLVLSAFAYFCGKMISFVRSGGNSH